MNGSKIRWGIMGSGWIAQRFAWDMHHSKTGKLVGIASRSKANSLRLAAEHKGTKAFDSYEELAQSDEIDVIYVATPNALHKEHCLLAIAAGKAVLCEKPFATNAKDATEIAEAATKANVFCMEAMWTRFLPIFPQVRHVMNSGVLGPLAHLEVTLGFAREERAGDPITDPVLGGGALRDLGCYGISIAEYLLGPFSITGRCLQRSGTGSIRTATFSLLHENEAGVVLSSISVSHAAQLGNTLTISGTKGRAVLDAPFIQSRKGYIFGTSQRNSKIPNRSLLFRFANSNSGKKVKEIMRPIFRRPRYFSASFPGEGLQFEIDEVGRCLLSQKKESKIMPLETTVSNIAALDKIENSGDFSLH